MMITQEQLAMKFKQVRQSHELSLQEVERETGISPSTLSRFEIGSGRLSMDHFIIIAQWLGVPLDTPMCDTKETFDKIQRTLDDDPHLNTHSRHALLRLMSDAYLHVTGR